VYFAGSQAAQWLDQNGQGNGDFDILIGIDFEAFRDADPQCEEMDDAEIATVLTDELWAMANVKDYYFTLKDGKTVGPFDRTFFCNPRAWDIKALHPYAAYNVTDDDWAVHPLQVPKSWSAQSLPESYWGYAESLVHEIEAIGQLPAEERHRMAANLYEELHTHRSDAFADGGHGLFDLSNVTEKYLDQHPDKPWAKLVQWKNDSPSGPEPWVPTTARRTTLTSLFASSPEICPKCGLSSRDHEEGYAEYGDCPFEEHITDWSRHERTMPETMHRGVHTTLPPDLHSLVHDTRRSTDERAQALRDHVDNFFGAASNRSAMHWTTRPEMAEEFAEGSHNGSRDSDQHTHVIFHAKSPTDFGPSGPVEIDPWALTHHGVFPYSPDHEAEIPLKRGAGIHLTGVSWRKGGGAGEWTHHEYAEPQIAKLAADGADYGGVMIAIVPPEKICKELAQDGGEPVEAMHVTLAYMPGQDRRKAARELPELVEGWARTQKALKGHVGGVGTFVNPGQHVLWAAVDIPHGGPFRQSLVEVLERHGYDVANDHGWTPHLTLAYRDHHVRFLPKIEPASWDITEVHICVGDDWTAVPLG
jgi:2'-5' RNA ligase